MCLTSYFLKELLENKNNLCVWPFFPYVYLKLVLLYDGKTYSILHTLKNNHYNVRIKTFKYTKVIENENKSQI